MHKILRRLKGGLAMTFEKTPWGRSIEILVGPKEEDGRTIESAGANYIEPKQMIPLHLHEENNEEYIPQTEGLKILVVSKEEMENMTALQIIDALHGLSPAEIGDVVTCPKGYAHALYNSSDSVGSFVFIKYN